MATARRAKPKKRTQVELVEAIYQDAVFWRTAVHSGYRLPASVARRLERAAKTLAERTPTLTDAMVRNGILERIELYAEGVDYRDRGAKLRGKTTMSANNERGSPVEHAIVHYTPEQAAEALAGLFRMTLSDGRNRTGGTAARVTPDAIRPVLDAFRAKRGPGAPRKASPTVVSFERVAREMFRSFGMRGVPTAASIRAEFDRHKRAKNSNTK